MKQCEASLRQEREVLSVGLEESTVKLQETCQVTSENFRPRVK